MIENGTYLLQCKNTNTRALLFTILTKKENLDFFNNIFPHEEIEISDDFYKLEKNIQSKNKLDNPLYIASIENYLGANLLIDNEKLNKPLASIDSKVYGKQEIYRIDLEGIDIVDSPNILLDGHHRYRILRDNFFNKNEDNESMPIPCLIVDFDNVKVEDHYFYTDPRFKDSIVELIEADFLITEDSEKYDLSSIFKNKKTFYKSHKDMSWEQRFEFRKKLVSSFPVSTKNSYGNEQGSIFSFPSVETIESDMKQDNFFLSIRSVEKEQIQLVEEGVIFPRKSTWITPKFNPALYQGLLT